MLIPEKFGSVIRVLLAVSANSEPTTTPTLAKKACLNRSMTLRYLWRLKKSGYLSVRGAKIRLLNRDKLIRAWGYCYSMDELEKREFVAAERPQYVMTRIANAGRAHRLMHAFTLFSATEVIRPYVAPSETHVYVGKNDVGKWGEIMKDENMLPTGRGGNVALYLVDEDYFEGVWGARGVNVVSLPQLYADLFSIGGRGEEAAGQILGIIRDQQTKEEEQ